MVVLSPDLQQFLTAPNICEITGSQEKLKRLIYGSAIMMGLGVIVVLNGLSHIQENPLATYKELIGIIGTILFGSALSFFVVRLQWANNIALRLTPDSILTRQGPRPREIPWDWISRVDEWQAYGTQMVILGISREDYLSLKPNVLELKLFDANAGLIGYPNLSIACGTLNITNPQLVALVTAYAQNYSPAFQRKQ